MYGYNQTNYTSPFSTANAAAAVAAQAYSGLSQPQPTQQQAASVFGTNTASNPYGAYGSSVSAAAAYANYTQPSSVAAAAANSAYAQAAQQAQVSRLAGLSDAYATALSNPAAAAAAAAQYSIGGYTQSSTGTPAAASTNYYRSNAQNAAATSAATAKAIANAAKTYAATGASAAAQMTPYDQAVFNATTSYLQSKNTGQSNVWMSKKPNYGPGAGGGKSFPKKNYNPNAPPKDQQMHVCEVCKITCAGQQTYKEHMEGQRHKKKVALAKGEQQQTLPRNKVSFRCEICSVTCTGQDTYNAHARGAKHQKALALCRKLGKPLPSDPTIIPPSEMGGSIPPPPPSNQTQEQTGAPIPTLGAGNSGPKSRVLGISMVSFVGGTRLSTTGQLEAKKQAVIEAVGSAGHAENPADSAIKQQSAEVQALLAAEQNVKPVGQEYIEEERDATGKLLQYNCKLCDCKFSDPNAKEIHLKGRRHRMQYKLKVDPKLEVDPKPSTRFNKATRGMKSYMPTRTPLMGPPVMPVPFWSTPGGGHPMMFEGRRFETADDRHVQAKHTTIYPDDEQLGKIEDLVIETEKALKRVSDFFHHRDHPEKDVTMGDDGKEPEKTEEEKEKEPDRLLKGVMRVGLLSEGLLLKGDKEVRLVVLCSHIPTVATLEEVSKLIQDYYQVYDKDPEGKQPLSVKLDVENSCFVLRRADVDMDCIVTLTSRLYREDNESSSTALLPGAVAKAPEPPVVLPANALNKVACLKALADLRHAKWFQARCVYLQSCQITLRILRDIRKRVNSWKPLTDWMCELLVEKVLTSYPNALSIGDALRRVIEAISAGLLLSSGPGIVDPCEKERVDVLACLNGQQREAITSSAQHALRLIAFNQIYKVLSMDRLPDVRPPLPPFGDRKRPNEGSVNGEDVKKDKKDESNEEEAKMEEN